LRLFFALWPSAQEQQTMSRASAAGVAGSGGRPLPAGNLHVTLAFLGNVDSSRLLQLRGAVRRLGAATGTHHGPLQLQFESLEYWVRPQILCAPAVGALPGSCRALALAAGIRQAALAAGFSPDLKPFRAHVTVARKVAAAPQVQPMARVTWSCDAFALIASRTGAAGSAYSVVESYALDRLENARK
jgi:RNA 2',3'-cyclic 3'-phosphodiesterase